MEGLFIFESCVSICIIHFSIRPSKSVSELIIWNFRFSLKSIATPDAFGLVQNAKEIFLFTLFPIFYSLLAWYVFLVCGLYQYFCYIKFEFLVSVLSCFILISVVCIVSYNSNKLFAFVGLSCEISFYSSSISLSL